MLGMSFLGAGITLGKAIYDMAEADKNTESANQTSVRAANIMGKAKAQNEASRKAFEDSRKRVINRKKAILQSSFPKFMGVYDKITKIEFNRNTEGIREVFQINNLREFEMYLGDCLTFHLTDLSDEQLLSGFVVEGMKGAVFGANPLISGITGSIVKDSELLKTAAYAQKKQARLYEEAVDAQKDAVASMCFFMDKTSEIIARFNGLFLKSIRVTENIIEKNGYDGRNYSEEEYAKIGVCMNLAAALKDIVDTPVTDANNEVTVAAKKLVETSEQFIKGFSELM